MTRALLAKLDLETVSEETDERFVLFTIGKSEGRIERIAFRLLVTSQYLLPIEAFPHTGDIPPRPFVHIVTKFGHSNKLDIDLFVVEDFCISIDTNDITAS